MRVVIHGGMHKTGTTAFQHLLYDNSALLLEHGVFYPAGGGRQHGGDLNTRRPGWTPAACQAHLAAARAAGAEILLLSGETVCTLTAEQIGRLRAVFAGLPVAFIYCFRHWIDYLPSRWAQYSLVRDTQDFDAYVGAVSDPRWPHPDWRFDNVLTAAIDGGATDVAAIALPGAQASPLEIPAAILRAAGAPEAAIAALAPHARFLNTRRPWALLEVTRLLNGAVADRLGLAQDARCLSLSGRMRSGKFDLWPQVEASPARDALLEIVEAHAVTRVLETLPGVETVEERLTAMHGHRFTDRADSGLFPGPRTARFQYADMDWRTLMRAHGPVVERALDALSLEGCR